MAKTKKKDKGNSQITENRTTSLLESKSRQLARLSLALKRTMGSNRLSGSLAGHSETSMFATPKIGVISFLPPIWHHRPAGMASIFCIISTREAQRPSLDNEHLVLLTSKAPDTYITVGVYEPETSPRYKGCVQNHLSLAWTLCMRRFCPLPRRLPSV